MNVELIISVFILVFLAYCYWLLGITSPPSIKAGVMSAADWPRFIIICLVVAISINVISICLKKKGGSFSEFKELFNRKFTYAFFILIMYAFILEYLGFITATFLFVIVFSTLIGLKKISYAVLGAFCSSTAIYVVFQIFLQVTLPRGSGIFREFSIFLESLF